MSVTAEPLPATEARLLFEPDRFRTDFGRRPFLIRHQLASHPLFQLPRLVELARALPEDRVEYNAGDVPVSLDPRNTPRTGLSAEETIRRIEECRSWMALKNVEQEAAFGTLLDECLDEVRTLSEAIEPGMAGREGFIFVSSPESVTPYHIDPEHNFLLQIRGRKQIRLFDGGDRSIIAEPELEAFYGGASRNLKFQSTQDAKALVFNLEPGDGLYFPVTWPHWVKNGPEVSISFSITFRTAQSDRREHLYRINHWLRCLKLRPRPVGRSPWIDSAKYFVFQTLRGARKVASRKKYNAGTS